MSLRTNVSQLQNDIPGQLALNRQVVLRRILRAHVGLEIAEQQHRPEAGPVLRAAGSGTQNPVEWVWTHCSALRNERRIKECCGQEGAASERRFCAELFQH